MRIAMYSCNIYIQNPLQNPPENSDWNYIDFLIHPLQVYRPNQEMLIAADHTLYVFIHRKIKISS